MQYTKRLLLLLLLSVAIPFSVIGCGVGSESDSDMAPEDDPYMQEMQPPRP